MTTSSTCPSWCHGHRASDDKIIHLRDDLLDPGHPVRIEIHSCDDPDDGWPPTVTLIVTDFEVDLTPEQFVTFTAAMVKVGVLLEGGAGGRVNQVQVAGETLTTIREDA